MGIAKNFVVKVVGLTFVEGYPDNIYRLNEAAEFAGITNGGEGEALPAVLVRNPENEFDSNAVEVHIPSLGESAMIGHVPAGVASKLAPSMDEGEDWAAEVDSVNIHPDHPTNPGIGLRIFKVSAVTAEPW